MAEQLPDRHFAGPGARSALFLFRQPWLLGPALLASAAFAAYLFLFRAVPLAEGLVFVGISFMVGFGAAVMIALPAFFFVRTLAAPPAGFTASDDEEMLHEGLANHFLADEGRGGRLHLTSRRLVFVPHRFNVQLVRVEIPLGAITRVGWRNILGPRGALLSTTLEVDAAGAHEVFVVSDASDVAARLESARRGGARAETGGPQRTS